MGRDGRRPYAGAHDRDGGRRHGHRADHPWPLWWERRRSAVLDVGLAVVSAVECAAGGGRLRGADAGLPVPVGVVFGLVAGAVLVLRRRWPIAVVLVSIAYAGRRWAS